MTESSKQKPREFWIFDDGGPEFDRRVLDRPISANDVHVIEASYARELEAKLAVAVKALEFYAQSRFDRDIMSWQNLPEPDKASSVLEQIKQLKAGLE